MKKFVIYSICTIMAALLMHGSIFADEMIKAGKTYYLIDSNDNICKNKLHYEKDKGSFYFGEDGKMKVGWFVKPDTKEVFFFANNPNNGSYGVLLTGYYYIDGYLRYFNKNGTLAKANGSLQLDIDGKYKADAYGNLFDKNGNLMRDKSTKRSDFYTDEKYYKDNSLNNKTLAESGRITLWTGEKEVTSDDDIKRMAADQTNKAKAILEEKANDKTKVVISNKNKK